MDEMEFFCLIKLPGGDTVGGGNLTLRMKPNIGETVEVKGKFLIITNIIHRDKKPPLLELEEITN